MEDKWQHAREQAQAQFESIKEMVETLEEACTEQGDDSDDSLEQRREEAQQRIHEDALSVEVRSGWEEPGQFCAEKHVRAEEYRILLCTGGPAVQIMGELSEHGEPETARLMMQDWGLPWTEYRPLDTAPGAVAAGYYLDPKAEEILLTYARQFYFGE